MRTASTRPLVLLLTHSADFYTIDRVADALTRRGARPVRLDTDRFPRDVKLSARLEQRGLRHVIADGGTRVEADEVRAVWARRLWTPQLDANLDERFRAMCTRESVAALDGFLDGLHAAHWVNNTRRTEAAENKPRQLRLAANAGLRIPRTLITNDPQEARNFFEELDGRVVVKLLKPLSVNMDASSVFVYTSDVRREDLADAATLRHSPVVFQERIDKARELRIAWVDGQHFTGAIDASRSTRGQTDWRLAAPDECSWQRDEIPADVARRLEALMRELGLVYGAVDLIRTPAGEYVFLEVNAGGEWGMLERDLGLAISEALADALLANNS
ncbi:MAG TPA: MvdC family ATP-grasp ribosomal peptide maturase [Pyrinomonadaceae bacterium]|jgi:MvdC family ATP-grasp ribosomal peptide maturase